MIKKLLKLSFLSKIYESLKAFSNHKSYNSSVKPEFFWDCKYFYYVAESIWIEFIDICLFSARLPPPLSEIYYTQTNNRLQIKT